MPGSVAARVAERLQRYGGWYGSAVAGPYGSAGLQSPPDPIVIEYGWLVPQLTFRPERPINAAEVTQSGASTARAADRTSQLEWGVNAFSVELQTACDADPAALAAWVMDFYATQPGNVPRARSSALVINLLDRTPEECQIVLRVGRGQRIRIANAPADWPAGASELIVEGRSDLIAVDDRTVAWWVAPVIGNTPGVAGPWFRVDSSSVDGSDILPF